MLAALANPERRIAALYATKEAAEEMLRCIDALSPARQGELPTIQESERRRLDAVQPSGDGEKAIHQGMLAAVWPLDAPDLDDCIATISTGKVRLLLLDQLSDPRNVGRLCEAHWHLAQPSSSPPIATLRKNQGHWPGRLPARWNACR